MYLVNPQIEDYIDKLVRKQLFDEEILEQMEKYAKDNQFPIVEREVGVFLYLITKLKKPKLIVEVGSGYGYSGYWFAKAVEEGKVVLTDYQEKNINMAKEFLSKADLIDKIEFKVGDGIKIAQEYENIDILFLDLEKARYVDAIKSLEKHLNNSAIVIADNVLWYGEVIKDNIDPKTEAIKEFNRYMFESGNFISNIVPIRDGVLMAIKT